MNIKLNSFKAEEYRAHLASEKKIKELILTYTKEYSEIPNNNTSKKWDYLNIEGRELLKKNPMEDHRICIIANLITPGADSVINIGFGSGSLEKKLENESRLKKIQWYGIDISHKSVEKAKKDITNGKFAVGNILNIKNKNNSFDYAISMEVLEHIPPSSILKALHEVYRVIKPGGYFICSVPLNEGLEEMISRGENPNAHVRIYTPDLIKAELEISGFKILKTRTLYAFHNFYTVKSFIANHILKSNYAPNNIILVSQKPL